MHGDGPPAQPAWHRLRSHVAAQARQLRVPRPESEGLCAACLGPARPGRTRCYQCDLHLECAPEGLADLVVPVAYAPKGGTHASHLWLYKADRERAGAAARWLRALFLVFLHDHGPCLWRRAGLAGPTHLAVVPSGRGRAGPHPLRRLIGPYLAGPWAELSARRSAYPARDLDPSRFAAPRLPGAAVLLLDDTWTSGSSAQSAALALHQGGARFVAVIVLGRHLDDRGWPDRETAAALPFCPRSCAVHDAGERAARRPPGPA